MQVEYKFEMQRNATMTYRWNATSPVHSDLHADRFDNPDDFPSAKIGTLPRRRRSLQRALPRPARMALAQRRR